MGGFMKSSRGKKFLGLLLAAIASSSLVTAQSFVSVNQDSPGTYHFFFAVADNADPQPYSDIPIVSVRQAIVLAVYSP